METTTFLFKIEGSTGLRQVLTGYYQKTKRNIVVDSVIGYLNYRRSGMRPGKWERIISNVGLIIVLE